MRSHPPEPAPAGGKRGAGETKLKVRAQARRRSRAWIALAMLSFWTTPCWRPSPSEMVVSVRLLPLRRMSCES